jgi:hypothetical protein
MSGLWISRKNKAAANGETSSPNPVKGDWKLLSSSYDVVGIYTIATRGGMVHINLAVNT